MDDVAEKVKWVVDWSLLEENVVRGGVSVTTEEADVVVDVISSVHVAKDSVVNVVSSSRVVHLVTIASVQDANLAPSGMCVDEETWAVKVAFTSGRKRSVMSGNGLFVIVTTSSRSADTSYSTSAVI